MSEPLLCGAGHPVMQQMPRLVLELADYFAPAAALLMFALAVLVFSFFVVNFFYITDRDDLTVFEKFGAQFHLCLGPHAMSDIYRGGPQVYPRGEQTNLAELIAEEKQNLDGEDGTTNQQKAKY